MDEQYTMLKCDLIPSVRCITDILYINVSKEFLFYILVTRTVCFTSSLFRNSSITMCRRYPKSLGGVMRARKHSGENCFWQK